MILNFKNKNMKIFISKPFLIGTIMQYSKIPKNIRFDEDLLELAEQ